MKYIKDKLSNINGELGFLFANEFNSIKNELSNVVKHRYALKDDETNQLLKAIITESKMNYYTDKGVVNEIVLERDGEPTPVLMQDQMYFFSPKHVNSGPVTVTIGSNGESKPILLNGLVIPNEYLRTNTMYAIIFNSSNQTFSLKEFSGSGSSDSFSELHAKSTFLELEASEVGSNLLDNDIVFIDQNTGKYEKSVIEAPSSQKQNAIGIFKNIDNKSYVFFSGIVHDFRPNLKPGFKFYLSNSNEGLITENETEVYIGRALKNNGFVLDISGEIGIDADKPSIRIWDTHLNHPEINEGIGFTDTTSSLTLMFNKKSFDLTIPAELMYASVDGVVVKMDFASEYENAEFEVEKDGLRYAGTFIKNESYGSPIPLTLYGEGNQPDPEPDPDPDPIPDPDVVYEANITTTMTDTGNTFTDLTSSMTLMFNRVNVDLSIPALIMFGEVNGNIIKLDFASEYTGNTFEVEVSNTRFIGTFTENSDFSNPIIINQK